MSLAFAQRGRGPPPNPQQIQKMLDENGHLINTIQDFQSKGKAQECMQYQQILHRNLVYLASIADSSQNTHNLLPVSISHFNSYSWTLAPTRFLQDSISPSKHTTFFIIFILDLNLVFCVIAIETTLESIHLS